MSALSSFWKLLTCFTPRGWLDNKRDADDKGAHYTYTPAGRLLTRTWQRGVLTTYTYQHGRLTNVAYSGETNGHTTPDLAYTYNAFGALDTVTRAGTLHADYSYSSDFLLTSEQLNQDTLVPRTLTRYYDNLRRPLSCALGTPADPASEHTIGYGYDPVGRLGTVFQRPTLAPDGTPASPDTFSYGYQTNSPSLLASCTGPVHRVTHTWEPGRNVLQTKANTLEADNSNLSTYTCTVNAIGQRTAVAQSGSAFAAASQIDWSYDPLGQLTSADHSESAKARAYAYDSIGNRTQSEVSNSQISNPPAAGTTTYTANPLNQYTTIQQGSDGVSPSFDPDGNATAYPLPTDPTQNATLTWDAENRLVKVATPTNGTIDYQYDYLSRRIIRSESANGLTITRHYLYDGWNCLAEHDKTASFPTVLSKTYLWGLDLSGSLQGAGGVGGLLTQFNHAANDPSAVTAFYPTYDGNGNVSEYLSESGAIVEHNEYDPFGNLTTGGTVSSFTYRFSTKPIDPLTGLYYYGYRYYDPQTGRWPSRDPLDDKSVFYEQNERVEIQRELDKVIAGSQNPIKLEKLLTSSTFSDVLEHEFEEERLRIIIEVSNPYHFVKNSAVNNMDLLGLITVAGCEALKDACDANCRALPKKVQRAICFSRCMAEYAACLASTKEAKKCCCVAGAAVLTGAAIACPFDGPAGDVAAAGLLCTALAQ